MGRFVVQSRALCTRKVSACIVLVLVVFFVFCKNSADSSSAIPGQVLEDSILRDEEYGLTPSILCLNHLFTKEWTAKSYQKMGKMANRCTSRLFHSLRALRLGRPNLETKYFLPPADHFDRCNVISLGVGTEIYAETALRLNLPQCTFLGVDPDAKTNKQLFEEELSGNFVETAVGSKSGEYVGNFLSNVARIGYELGYLAKKTPHQGLEDFLRSANGLDQTVDLLLMDVEGAEFDMFDVLITDLDRLPTICQFNVEIHTPSDSDTVKPHVVDQLNQLLMKSKFIPLRVDDAPFGFYRAFMFNYGSTKCLKKYFKLL